MLNTVSEGKNVIISEQQVTIGGSYRIPDVIKNLIAKCLRLVQQIRLK